MMIYAGIGSRKTPDDILEQMQGYAAAAASFGWLLRSGGAVGADQAFEVGCGKGAKEIFRPHQATREAIELSAKYHPNWHACTPYAKSLHGRNAMIVLGRNLDDPVNWIACWTPGGKMVGGTAQALRIAQDYNIEIENWGSE